MDTELYPPAPAGVPADLAAPTGRYKRQTAAAVIGVVAFFLLYLGMTYWFGLVAYRAFAAWGEHTKRALFVGIPSAFLCLVLLKGLFVRQKLSRDSLLQITADEEPELFRFIHRVADDIGAPRPHKVFLSPDVNAAVFLDVGLINLIIPSRKNLIVGIGLVNSLTLDELKAVIAHEFGHFAQRSMGVGQWVYVAEGFVRNLIARRDMLDDLVHWISRFDFRIAWIGWGLRLLIWALRSMIDQLFRFVVLLSRALTRQMEFQADLVSVSVAGSDSLVHALHRLPAADRGWGEAASFVVGQAQKGRRTEDLFAVQSRFIERYREVHALPDHGQTPRRPSVERSAHRVFAHSIADVPQMWSTHPSNKDREESCKAQYFESHLDERSAWLVFRDPELVRRRMTSHFLDLAMRPHPDDPAPPAPVEMVSVPLEESLRTVDEIFGRAALDRRYQGLYTTMAMTRALAKGESLHVPPQTDDPEQLLGELEQVFDDELSEQVEEFFQLDEELAQLEGLKLGVLEAPGGVIAHRGRQLRRKELRDVCAETKAELEGHRRALGERFRRARGAGLRIARILDERRGAGEGGTRWELHLEALAELLHYAEHTGADLVDNVTFFEHVLAIVFADGNVSQSEMRRLVAEGAELSYTIRRVFEERQQVLMPAPVRQRLTKDGLSWEELIGPQLHLSAPTEHDFANDWIGIAATWWSPYLQSLQGLATSTLDVLLEAEEYLATCLKNGSDPGDAPAAGSVPESYREFPFGSERERQERLGWWDRFQVAEGFAGGAMRFLVAGALLAPAVAAGFMVSERELWLYNGLDRTVVVDVDGDRIEMLPGMDTEVAVDGDSAAIRTTTESGELIEELTIDDLSELDQPVYNVAAAGAFARWWAVYGVGVEPDPVFQTGRVLEADAEYLFREPPSSISSRGSQTRAVFDSLDDPLVLPQVLNGAERELAETHLRWDGPESLDLGAWIALLPAERQSAAARERFEAHPSARTWVLLHTFANQRVEDEVCGSGQSFPEAVAALCAGDERIETLAAEGNRAWLRMLAGDRALRLREYDRALVHYGSVALRGVLEAAILSRRARVLRAMGRYDDAAALPREGDAYFDYVMTVESGADPAVGAMAQARARGDHGADVRQALATEATADEMAFAAASEGAPLELAQELASDGRSFRSPTAAVTAWALGWRLADPELRARAAAAYAELDGALDLEAIDLPALRETPDVLLAGEERHSIRTQAELRLAAWIAWEGEVPTEWRELVHAVLFLAERPALER